ncbi:MAG: amino acid ABC transporter substrate-binding protein [Chitinophagales bacterium]|nr:amino acid ABC transporter substrate-binding protein [Chitinophagales bacterium]
MKRFAFAFLLIVCSASAKSQSDLEQNINIGLMLPFQTQSSLRDIEDFFNAPDYFTASRISLNSYSEEALDFYEGTRLALNKNEEKLHINLHLYDCWNNDSVTEAWLAKPELRELDILIGPSSTANARIVAEFCRKNKILNVQPFTPSKSLTAGNPYHIKLTSTIDSHVDNMFLSVLDTFSGDNIIIYSPESDASLSAAKRFDSLFNDFNKTSSAKFTVNYLTTKKLTAEKRSVSSYLAPKKRNVLLITSFEGSFVNSTLRLLMDEKKHTDIVVYGMPTWLNSEVLRLDYVNSFNTRITAPFYADTTKSRTAAFVSDYQTTYAKQPTEMSYMGYDVMNFLLYALSTYGKNFTEDVTGERYTGTGYKFDIVRVTDSNGNINYYENRHVNVFRIADYRMERIW